jgi:hypothetical protein
VLWVTVRSIAFGWATLFAVTYLLARPLLRWTAPLLGASWLPTAELALACTALAATGWIIGRWNRSHTLPAVVAFAATLAVWNFGLVPAINIAWLFRLIVDVFGNPRYLESLITTAAIHTLLFGSLFVGARLSRPAQNPLSLATQTDKMDNRA